jgi:hypothetical protein
MATDYTGFSSGEKLTAAKLNALIAKWVYLNGTLASGLTQDGHNVASITDNGTGDYTVNWSTAFDNVSYGVVVGNNYGDTSNQFMLHRIAAIAVGSTRLIFVRRDTGAAEDINRVCMAAFGDSSV